VTPARMTLNRAEMAIVAAQWSSDRDFAVSAISPYSNSTVCAKSVNHAGHIANYPEDLVC